MHDHYKHDLLFTIHMHYIFIFLVFSYFFFTILYNFHFTPFYKLFLRSCIYVNRKIKLNRKVELLLLLLLLLLLSYYYYCLLFFMILIFNFLFIFEYLFFEYENYTNEQTQRVTTSWFIKYRCIVHFLVDNSTISFGVSPRTTGNDSEIIRSA